MCCSATSSIQPRGRIYLIKDMLENDRPATAEVVKHIDRCLSCLSCMTTCPSGVHYMHLVDHARAHIETTYRASLARPPAARGARRVCCRDRNLFRWPMLAALARPSRWRRCSARSAATDLAAMLRLVPARLPRGTSPGRRVYRRQGRAGPASRCCAAASPRAGARHQRGGDSRAEPRTASRSYWRKARDAAARSSITWAASTRRLTAARTNVDAWMREIDGEGLDAIVTTRPAAAPPSRTMASCCATIGLRAKRARAVAKLGRDISQFMSQLEVECGGTRPARLIVAYHGACSLQHGQKITREPKELLSKSGFVVKDVPEGHLCCGSAGTYNMLQPELAGRLARSQDREYREGRSRRDRRRQYRLHHADRGGHRNSGRPSGRADRLGDRRAGAGSGGKAKRDDPVVLMLACPSFFITALPTKRIRNRFMAAPTREKSRSFVMHLDTALPTPTSELFPPAKPSRKRKWCVGSVIVRISQLAHYRKRPSTTHTRHRAKSPAVCH